MEFTGGVEVRFVDDPRASGLNGGSFTDSVKVR
jgi:hypothetical protein